MRAKTDYMYLRNKRLWVVILLHYPYLSILSRVRNIIFVFECS